MPTVDRQKSFLSAATQGKGEHWRYILVILGLCWAWWNISGEIALLCAELSLLITRSTEVSRIIGNLAPFGFMLVLLYVAIILVHERSLQTLINAENAINFKRLGLGFGTWFLLSTIFFIPYVWINPQDYEFTFQFGRWFAILPVLLILTPLQTSTEELIFRGYLMQGLSLFSKNPITLSITTGLAFAIPHFGNPEMQRGFFLSALEYFLWGIFFAAISLKDNGLELSLGAHAANNLFIELFINTPDSVLPTPAIWTYIKPIHAGESLMSLLLFMMLFYAIFFGGIPRRRSLQQE